jgi:uncharacterized protein YdiU (UPF0061 family)
LIEDLLALMEKDGADFTNTFAALGTADARDQFSDRDAFDAWAVRWGSRVASDPNAIATMAAANPKIIPRNHRIETMIQAAVASDFAPFERLMAALTTPFENTDDDLTNAPIASEIVPATFCGT